MRPVFKRAVIPRQTCASLISLFLVLVLGGCSLGEAMLPAPPTGVAADRAAGTVVAVPNPIPHTLEGREDCFVCHAMGAVDAPAIPPNHEDDVTLCTACHAVWLAPVIAAAAPPAIPHQVEGREDCLVCHNLGTADAPRMPDNHDGLAGDICQTCHTQMSEVGQGGGAEVPVVEIPLIPHALEGFSACTSCHAEGGSGIPRMPENHEGRTDNLCSACHKPAAEVSGVTPPVAPETPTAEAAETPALAAGDAANGEILFGTNCAVCHGSGGEGAAFAPEPINDKELLAGLSDEDLITIMHEGLEGRMPARSNLDAQELLDLVAFIRNW
jgi:predicted CXXCH cytochrome family protein